MAGNDKDNHWEDQEEEEQRYVNSRLVQIRSKGKEPRARDIAVVVG